MDEGLLGGKALVMADAVGFAEGRAVEIVSEGG